MMDNERDDMGKRGSGDISKGMAMRKRCHLCADKISRIDIIFSSEIESDRSYTHDASATLAAVDWFLNCS